MARHAAAVLDKNARFKFELAQFQHPILEPLWTLQKISPAAQLLKSEVPENDPGKLREVMFMQSLFMCYEMSFKKLNAQLKKALPEFQAFAADYIANLQAFPDRGTKYDPLRRELETA